MIYNDDTDEDDLSIDEMLKEERSGKAGGDVYEESEEGIAYTLPDGDIDLENDREK